MDGQIAIQPGETSTEEEMEVNSGTGVQDLDEGTVVFGSKSKGKIRRSPMIRPTDPVVRDDSDDTAIIESSSEDTILKTPMYEEDPIRSSSRADTETTLKLIVCTPQLVQADIQYDLLQPLLKLYRNGHIQSSDPVYLPPISPSQLPGCLRPQGDLEKGRNVWFLGGRVVRRLLDLDIMRAGTEEPRRVRMRRKGVEVMARYIVSRPSLFETRYHEDEAVLCPLIPCSIMAKLTQSARNDVHTYRSRITLSSNRYNRP